MGPETGPDDETETGTDTGPLVVTGSRAESGPAEGAAPGLAESGAPVDTVAAAAIGAAAAPDDGDEDEDEDPSATVESLCAFSRVDARGAGRPLAGFLEAGSVSFCTSSAAAGSFPSSMRRDAARIERLGFREGRGCDSPGGNGGKRAS